MSEKASNNFCSWGVGGWGSGVSSESIPFLTLYQSLLNIVTSKCVPLLLRFSLKDRLFSHTFLWYVYKMYVCYNRQTLNENRFDLTPCILVLVSRVTVELKLFHLFNFPCLSLNHIPN